MTERNDNCYRMHECSCDCPDFIGCPYDDVPSEKDRSLASNKRHCDVKAKRHCEETKDLQNRPLAKAKFTKNQKKRAKKRAKRRADKRSSKNTK